MELRIGTLLRVGVVIAASVTAIGGLLLAFREGMTPIAAGKFRHEPVPFTGLDDLLAGLPHGEPRSIILFGVVLLVATPIARVGATLVAFVYQRDRFYTGVAAVVLAILLYSLFSGAGLG